MSDEDETESRQSAMATLGHHERSITATVTVLCVLAFGVVAAAFPREHPALQTFSGPRDAISGPVTDSPEIHCPAILTEWWLLVALLVAVIGFTAVSYRRSRSVVLPALVSAPVYIGWVLLCDPFPDYSVQTGVGMVELSAPMAISQVLLALLVVLFALHVVAGGWLWQFVAGPSDISTGPEPVDRDESELAGIGDRAGEIADRIEQHDSTENLVYDAWREMTALVDVSNPESCTPGEFAEAAFNAGLAPEHIEELTRLFESVRYGDQEPEPYETRAVRVLRRIQAAYDSESEER